MGPITSLNRWSDVDIEGCMNDIVRYVSVAICVYCVWFLSSMACGRTLIAIEGVNVDVQISVVTRGCLYICRTVQ